MNKLFLILALMAINSHIYTQEAKEEMLIRASIQNIFDGMRAGDSSKVAKSFFRKAVMFSNFSNKEGKPVVKKGSLDKWLGGIGSPHDEIWDERISNLKIDVDGEVAQAWMDYEFFVGNTFHHCGSDAFQLLKNSGEWKVVSGLDTRKKSCQGDLESPLTLLKMQVKAFNEANLEKLGANVTEDFIYAYIDANALIKQSVGRDAFVSDMRGYFENVKEVKSEILNYTISGNTISFNEEVSWTGEKGRLSQRSMGVYQMKQGKISRAWYFIQ